MKEIEETTPLSPSDGTNKKLDRAFDNSERMRTFAALTELRECCTTNEAIRGFEDFESQLLKRLGMSRHSLHRAGSVSFGCKDADRKSRLSISRGLKPLPWTLPRSPGSGPTIASRVSSVNAEAIMMATSSKAFYGDCNLAKSKTTGNLASLIPSVSKEPQVGEARNRHKTSQVAPSSHRRTTSYFECSADVRIKAIKEREARAARRAAEAHRRSSSGLASLGIGKSSSQNMSQVPPTKNAVVSEPSHSGATLFKVAPFDQVVDTLDCAMLESGHGIPPKAISTSFTPRVELVKVPGGGKEKVIKSRRKTERQISGELMKNLFGAGMREMKRMGRRVSGMNWPGSSEDLLSQGRK